MKQQITPCLWFNNQAKEAATFYSSHLKNSKIVAQSPIVSEIEVSGQNITLLDGGPMYQPNASISFFYICETADELNDTWEAFSKEASILMPLDKYDWSEMYGWLNDRFGISWQFSLGKIEDVGQKLTPSLLFAGDQYGRAEEAVNFYSTIFKNNLIDGILR
ncbi:MAG: VOC family protein, partial [Chitinophagaceae bacterium]